jgi:hypothetical protein
VSLIFCGLAGRRTSTRVEYGTSGVRTTAVLLSAAHVYTFALPLIRYSSST